MPKPPSLLPTDVRSTDKLAFAQFAQVFPESEIKKALEATGRRTMRERDLPNHLVVYFVMMMALFREAAQQEVLRVVYQGFEWLFGQFDFKPLAKSAISQARSRVGWEPLAKAFEDLAKPLAEDGAAGCFFKGLRVVAIDGSLFNVPDTHENAVLGRALGKNGEGAFPQVRAVSLVECGTHAIFRTSLGAFRDSEKALAKPLFEALDETMICLADRNFMGYEQFKAAAAQGAKLLWRVSSSYNLYPEERLPDGSYLCSQYPQNSRKNPVVLRVITYAVEGKGRETIRLVTNFLDYKTAPASELAELYHQRWEYENVMDEVKAHLNANSLVLRSNKPDLAFQELLGIFMAHYAVRKMMHAAASRAGIDDDELSFTHSVRVIRRRLPMFGNFPPGTDSGSDHEGHTAATRLLQQGTV